MLNEILHWTGYIRRQALTSSILMVNEHIWELHFRKRRYLNHIEPWIILKNQKISQKAKTDIF